MALCPVCNTELQHNESSCPSCGFHLMDATEQIEPIKIEGLNKPVNTSGNRKYELRIVRGPSTGIEIALHKGTSSIGRDPRCDVFLNDMTVSRNHAFIEATPDGCIIRDNGSVNGVWVNNRMAEVCSLKAGDLIQIGTFCLLYNERS